MFLSHVSLTVIDTDKVLTGESCKSSVTQRPAAVWKTPYTVRTMKSDCTFSRDYCKMAVID